MRINVIKWLSALFLRYANSDHYNPLSHAFIFITFINGISFLFFPNSFLVNSSALALAANVSSIPGNLSVFGLACLAATAMLYLTMIFKKEYFAAPSAMLGFMCWLYASLVFVSGGHFFQFLVDGAPNMFFWMWLYATMSYRRAHGLSDRDMD